MLGREFYSPMYVIDGLSKCAYILGIDFIRDSQLCISADHVFFSNLPATGNMMCSVLTPVEDWTVPARSVIRIPVKVKSARDKKMPWGTFGISTMAHDDRQGVRDSWSKVDSEARVFSVFANALQHDQFFKQGEIVRFFQPVQGEDIMEHDLPEAWIDEHGLPEAWIDIFSDLSREAKDPKVGPSASPLSEEERRFLSEIVDIKAPLEILHRYQQLIFDYHDVRSKSKFDIERTDVIEHKVVLNSWDQIYVLHFRIPFKYRQTIYGWVDEFLKKGAIEVSRSCFNSPIFLVPKPHGHGVRAVLDFREANNASVPDWYTIREVRDYVDEIGLADSKEFSTIDLTSGFWLQSLEEESAQLLQCQRKEQDTSGLWLQWDFKEVQPQGVLTYINDVLVHTFEHKSQLALLLCNFSNEVWMHLV